MARALRALLPMDAWESAGGVVLNERHEVAIVRQRDRKRRLRWTLPKGRIDAGESAERAALREVYEETGLRARILRPLLLHEGARHFTYYYEMALDSDDGVHDRETKEVRFVAVWKAARLVRGKRDLAVLRRLVETRTGVVAT
jgi:ADP-ribose pyrophosphatase YjhB (NUDIX family)